MPNYQLPLVDYENPCYCPEVSADSYFETLLDRFDGFAFSREDIQISSFADMLCNYANEDGMLDLLQSRKDRVVRKQNPFQYPPGRARKKPITNASLAPEAALISRSKYPSIMDGHQATLHQAKSKKRKLPFNDQRESFTDIVAPVKRGRSSVSVNVASFDFSDPGDPPIFAKSGYDSSSSRGSSEERTCVTPFAGPSEYIKQAVSVDSRLKSLEEYLHGPEIGNDTPRSLHVLVSSIDSMLPGIRIKESLLGLPNLTHQGFVDRLTKQGILDCRILPLFRASRVSQLDLTKSVQQEGGLNMFGLDLLKVLSMPNSFRFVTEIKLCDTPMKDLDLIHLHHLPRLSQLCLDNTTIGNEAIFHLVSLRRTLKDLSISENPCIDNDAVPALLLLSKLCKLNILDTCIGMQGLRRFAKTINDEDREIDIILPYRCADYIENMHTQYLIDPRSPLITSPHACSELSTSALKRNLAEHAKYNGGVIVGGTKDEMVEGLRRLLERRKRDLLVREMMWNGDKRSLPATETEEGQEEDEEAEEEDSEEQESDPE